MSSQHKPTRFLVVGAGLPRTGTMSLKAAYEILFSNKCYHMIETGQHEEEWFDIFNEKYSDEEFSKFFLSNGYVASVDYPFVACLDQALRAFPDAKVVLSVRDKRKWCTSMQNTILRIAWYRQHFPLNMWRKFGFFNKYLQARKFHLTDTKNQMFQNMITAVRDGNGEEYFADWVENVKEKVPTDNLLIFDVKEGWEPLCNFLSVPVPKVPLPNVNDTQQFNMMLMQFACRGWLLLYEAVSIPALLAVWFKYLR